MYTCDDEKEEVSKQRGLFVFAIMMLIIFFLVFAHIIPSKKQVQDNEPVHPAVLAAEATR